MAASMDLPREGSALTGECTAELSGPCSYRFRKAPSAARGWRCLMIAVGLLGGEGPGRREEGASLEEPPLSPGKLAPGG